MAKARSVDETVGPYASAQSIIDRIFEDIEGFETERGLVYDRRFGTGAIFRMPLTACGQELEIVYVDGAGAGEEGYLVGIPAITDDSSPRIPSEEDRRLVFTAEQYLAAERVPLSYNPLTTERWQKYVPDSDQPVLQDYLDR